MDVDYDVNEVPFVVRDGVTEAVYFANWKKLRCWNANL
jgi:hypothetical protein